VPIDMLSVAVVAVVIGAALAIVWARWRLPRSLGAAVAWLLYAPYEFLMHARVLCTGECNIRVDLLLVWPLLALLTLAIPLRVLLARRRSRQQR
jgi:hypothetical protein